MVSSESFIRKQPRRFLIGENSIQPLQDMQGYSHQQQQKGNKSSSGLSLKFHTEQAYKSPFDEYEKNSIRNTNVIRKSPERLDHNPFTSYHSKFALKVDSDGVPIKHSMTEYEIAPLKHQEKNPKITKAPMQKFSTYSNIPLNLEHHDMNEVDKVQGIATINNFPASMISMKRAISPLMSGSTIMNRTTLPLKTETSPTDARIQAFETITCQSPILRSISIREKDKTPVSHNYFGEPNFEKNFERALQHQKSYIQSPTKRSSDKYNNTSLKNFSALYSQDFNDGFSESCPSPTKRREEQGRFKTTSFLQPNLNSIRLKSPSRTTTESIMNSSLLKRQSVGVEQEKYVKGLDIKINKLKILPQSAANTARSELTSQRSKLNSTTGKEENSNSKTLLKQIFELNFLKRTKCSCDAYASENDTCSKALGWISKKYQRHEFEYLEMTYHKILSENKLTDVSQIQQIKKDINRTYPTTKYFASNTEGVAALERILSTFAKYDPQIEFIGYVQGMNFIAASLLFHAEEYLAFWLLVMIFEIFEMRDIYLPKLPGLSKHCQIIDILVFNYQHSLYTHLCQNGIKVEMFCSEWIFALFASVIPVENMASFYDKLLEEGWPFFYKIILAFLHHFSKKIKEQSDFADILTVLKSQNHITKQNSKVSHLFTVDWNSLFKKAQKIQIDASFIYTMHSNFDVKNQWFRTTLID